MKKIIVFLSVLLFALNSNAQGISPTTYPINIDSSANGLYLSIGGQDYMRGSLGISYNYTDSFDTKSGTYDSTLCIYWCRNGALLYKNVLDTMFYNNDSAKQYRNMQILRNWFRKYNYIDYTK